MRKQTTKLFTSVVTVILLLTVISHMAVYASDRRDQLIARQEEVHAAADLLRELGIPEDNEAIMALQEEWWRCQARLFPCFTEQEVVMLAKTMWGEAGGIKSLTEIACIGWTACNRVDDPAFPNTVAKVLTQPNQFYYRAGFPVKEQLIWLAHDVLERWNMERLGYWNAGRVLPHDYFWYAGDGSHNYFRNVFRGGKSWGYSLPTPYES